MNKMYSRKEAAAILGISVSTLDNARKAGEISYVHFVPGCASRPGVYNERQAKQLRV